MAMRCDIYNQYALRASLLSKSHSLRISRSIGNAQSFHSRRLISNWRPVVQLHGPPSVEDFQQQALHAGKPVKLAPGSIPIQAHGTWLTATTAAATYTSSSPSSSSSPPTTTLNTAYLRQFASTVYLPMELSIPGQPDVFHRSEAAPLSLFLDAWEALGSPPDARDEANPQHEPVTSTHPQQSSATAPPRIYIAQSPLSLLPAPLAAAFAIGDGGGSDGSESIGKGGRGPGNRSRLPDLVARAGAGDAYGSSLWLGAAPTATPLHRDPNPNVLAQVAGRKRVRLLAPERGAAVYARAMERLRAASGSDTDDPTQTRGGGGWEREGGGGGSFGASERFRGESMMKGRERDELERLVWGDGRDGDWEEDGHGLAFEATLDPGDALFLPLGWWHAVRGVGQGINMSVNWWFR